MTERTYPQGVPSWVDIEQADVEAALAFYSAVLGWTFHEAAPPGSPTRYVIAQVDGLDVAGVGSACSAGPDWHTYVSVADVGVTLDRVRAAGGQVTVGPTVAGEGGTWAELTDPSGALLRLWQPRRRLGAQVVNAPGTWNFSDRHADDPATAFYSTVLGWQFDEVDFGTMIRVPGYGDHLAATSDPDIYARQAAVAVPPGFADAIGWVAPADADRPAHWHVSFAVADRDRTAQLAVAHGGQVLGTQDTRWARTVTVRDPQGAVFTASQFTPPE
ncbi:VOC family protein [Cellulomonas fengjieae]|uniref:VOC family protein n=1 Tax=Cellulomonas fengjieae TaxID=2819978 RepID=UPI001AB00EA3|nr:VOC family protein [Cellulomonas fengjieae]MBO3101899.1 VOC family protein [Cellulomonas fengjieae]